VARHWIRDQNVDVLAARPTNGIITRWGLAYPTIKLNAEDLARFLATLDPPVHNVVIKCACGVLWVEQVVMRQPT